MDKLKNTFLLKIIVSCWLVTFLTGFIFLTGCSEVPAKKEPVQISVEKVDEILKTQKDSYTILDVRTKEEFAGGHLDSAVLIPVDDLEARFGELEKNKPVIVYCRTGRRSAKAAAILVSKGFSQVYDMTGGIEAWISKGYPVIVENTGSTSESTQQSENTVSAVDTSAISGVNYITADELNTKAANKADIIILDVRSQDSYMVKHIKGAVNIPYREFESRTGELDSSKEIIIYCSNYDCGLSLNAVTLLAKSGFKNVFALEGGIESWQDKGYPVE